MKTWIYLLILSASCAIGKREVKFAEMRSEPKLQWNGKELIIKTENSKENSALLIYDIESIIDNNTKLILLHGFQAGRKEFKTEFRIKLTGVQVDIESYKIYWVDPDGSRTELRTNKASIK